MMAQFSGGKSSLNPNAPLFIPASFRQVEDFSPEWWQLITTSTWYKEYWLSQHEAEDGFYNNAEDDFDNNDITNLLPDSFDLGELPSDLELQSEEFFQSLNTETDNTFSHLSSEVEVAEIQMNNLSLLQSSLKASADPAKSAEKPVSESSPKCLSPGSKNFSYGVDTATNFHVFSTCQWSNAMSLDLLWHPLCTAQFPPISALKITNPSIAYRRLYSLGNAAAKRRSRPPLKPHISIDSLVFSIHVRSKNGGDPIAKVSIPVNEALPDANGLFKFDIVVEKGAGNEAVQEVWVVWNVVMRGVREAVFTMMDVEGKLKFVASGEGKVGAWFSEELPAAGCCIWSGGSGVVADLKLESGGGGIKVW